MDQHLTESVGTLSAGMAFGLIGAGLAGPIGGVLGFVLGGLLGGALDRYTSEELALEETNAISTDLAVDKAEQSLARKLNAALDKADKDDKDGKGDGDGESE